MIDIFRDIPIIIYKYNSKHIIDIVYRHNNELKYNNTIFFSTSNLNSYYTDINHKYDICFSEDYDVNMLRQIFNKINVINKNTVITGIEFFYPKYYDKILIMPKNILYIILWLYKIKSNVVPLLKSKTVIRLTLIYGSHKIVFVKKLNLLPSLEDIYIHHDGVIICKTKFPKNIKNIIIDNSNFRPYAKYVKFITVAKHEKNNDIIMSIIIINYINLLN